MTLHDLKRAVALRPSDVQARLALADALVGESDLLAAEKQIDAARALSPDDPAARLSELSLLVRQERFAKAEASALSLLELRGDDPKALLAAADAFVAMRRLLEAAIFLERAVELGDAPLDRVRRLGERLFALGYASRALPHLQRAQALGETGLDDAIAEARLECEDGFASVIGRGRDVLLGRLRDTFRGVALGPAFDEASRAVVAGDLSALKRALALLPAPMKETSWFDVLRGEARLCEGQPSAAVEAFERAVQRDPTHELARARLADALLFIGEPARARTTVAAAPDVEKSAALQELLGDAARALRDLDAAERAYVAARALAPHGEAGLKLARLRGARKDVEPGRVFVLGWNPFGGAASPVEAVAVAGNGQLRITGNVTRNGRDAAEVAHTCLKAKAKELGIADRVEKVDLHLHYDDTAVQKSGTSSGLALTLAGWSAIAGRPLPRGLATTGEITPQGGVRAIDGLREKLAAAFLSECPIVLFPRKNLLAWEKVPSVIRSRVNALPVDTLDEAFDRVRAHEAR